MTSATVCVHHRSAPSLVLAGLPETQSGVRRHKCVACAYDAGAEDRRVRPLMPPGHVASCEHGSSRPSSRAPAETMQDLPQADAGHEAPRCAICAYQAGFMGRILG